MNTKMLKLFEWHIYGNEQQGKFVIRRPESEPLYYLANLTIVEINKNFFRVMDRKVYEIKDHLGNVRVAIGDMKIPSVIHGQAPFYVKNCNSNLYSAI